MARIYKRSDRITVKIDDVTVKLAPLTLEQKTQIAQKMIEAQSKMDIRAAQDGIAMALKFSLKGIDGIEDSDGNGYQLQFEGDELTEACVDDLLNLEFKEKLTMVCMALMKGVPSQFSDEKQQALEGVELVNPPKASKKKS